MAWRTYLALFVGMALFGSATPVARLVAQGLPVLVGSALRVLLACLVLVPLARARGLRWSALQGDRGKALVLGAVGVFGFTVMLAYGMQRVPGVTGSIVMGTTPAVTAAGGVLFLRERATWRRWTAVGLAVVGVVALRVGGGGLGFEALGVALVFGAVLGEATYTLVGKRLTASLDPVGTTAVACVAGLPFFLVAAAPGALTMAWQDVTLRTWLAVAWWGLGTLALGSVVWYLGVRAVPGHVAAGFMGVMPLSALVLSYVLLGEDPQWWHLPGFLLVTAAVGLVAWDHGRGKT